LHWNCKEPLYTLLSYIGKIGV